MQRKHLSLFFALMASLGTILPEGGPENFTADQQGLDASSEGEELSEEEIMRYIQMLEQNMAAQQEQDDEAQEFDLSRMGPEEPAQETNKSSEDQTFTQGNRLAFSCMAGIGGLVAGVLMKSCVDKHMKKSGAQKALDDHLKKHNFITKGTPETFKTLGAAGIAFGSAAAVWFVTGIANKYIAQNKRVIVEIAEEKFTKSIGNKLVPDAKVFDFAKKTGIKKALGIANKAFDQTRLNIEVLTQAAQASSTTDPSVIAEQEILEEKRKTIEARLEILRKMVK